MLQTPPTRTGPQPPRDWMGRFARRLAHVHPGADPKQSAELAARLWAANATPETAADAAAALLPGNETDSA